MEYKEDFVQDTRFVEQILQKNPDSEFQNSSNSTIYKAFTKSIDKAYKYNNYGQIYLKGVNDALENIKNVGDPFGLIFTILEDVINNYNRSIVGEFSYDANSFEDGVLHLSRSMEMNGDGHCSACLNHGKIVFNKNPQKSNSWNSFFSLIKNEYGAYDIDAILPLTFVSILFHILPPDSLEDVLDLDLSFDYSGDITRFENICHSTHDSNIMIEDIHRIEFEKRKKTKITEISIDDIFNGYSNSVDGELFVKSFILSDDIYDIEILNEYFPDYLKFRENDDCGIEYYVSWIQNGCEEIKINPYMNINDVLSERERLYNNLNTISSEKNTNPIYIVGINTIRRLFIGPFDDYFISKLHYNGGINETIYPMVHFSQGNLSLRLFWYNIKMCIFDTEEWKEFLNLIEPDMHAYVNGVLTYINEYFIFLDISK
ncbi:hypothetical protein TVAGG3_0254260 [Trichomonas vaginalis G3]|uniref:hypothetical protein n=1 Tax=Trichomonas vaginalis (strain ATCC PRA-98 / G3) TaxID=412133 RepID=UPI0021E55A26|nr:hypothetical protein TVAGG3_0254260 [Trichomonas vaginalis G3]KAI5554248.1 hypothetical protein TVAGG3_0254260 [Trichomonas vaginalis G3]